MFKEVAQIQKLESRRKRLSDVIDQRESLFGRIGTGSLKTGIDIDVTIKIGNTRKSVRESAVKLKESLNTFESKAEETVLETARNYSKLIEEKREKLAQLSEMVADPDTGLTVDDLRIHQQEFEELVTLPQRSTLFQRGLDKVEKAQDDLKPTNHIEVDSKSTKDEQRTYILSNGEEVKGKVGVFLYLTSKASEQNPVGVDDLLREMSLGMDREIAKGKLRSIIGQARDKFRTKGEKKEIVNANLAKKNLYVEGAYFIKPLEQPQTIEQPQVEVKEIPEISRVDAFVQGSEDEAKSLFEEVTKSADFIYAQDVTRRFGESLSKNYNGDTNPQLDNFRNHLAGYLFEQMAFLHLKNLLTSEGKILLSPNETLEIYYQLEPTRTKVVHGFGLLNSLDGISVPDGIVIDFTNKNIPRITAISEYSLLSIWNGDFKKKLSQLDGSRVQDMRRLSESTRVKSSMITQYIYTRYPELRPLRNIRLNENLKQFTVIPEGVNTLTGDSRVETIHLPVNTEIFGKFVDAFMIDIFSRKFAAK